VRRLAAVSLLVLFGFFLIGPALFAAPDSQFPECCRRLGRHHCAMPGEAAQQQAPGFRNIAERCPYFPASPATPVHRHTPIESAGRIAPVLLSVRTPIASEIPQGNNTSVNRSNPKRGPPSLVL